MKFTIEMNVYELARSIKAGTLEALVKDVQAHEDEVRKIKSNSEPSINDNIPETTNKTPQPDQVVKHDGGTSVNEETSATKEEEDSVITIEQIRAKFIEKNTAQNKAKLKDILNRFGVSKVTDLKESDFAAVLEALEAL